MLWFIINCFFVIHINKREAIFVVFRASREITVETSELARGILFRFQELSRVVEKEYYTKNNEESWIKFSRWFFWEILMS